MINDKIPSCCYQCEYFDFIPTGIWDESPEVPSCVMNVKFPTKKQSCKRKSPKEANHG
jgi:hypothetical protein